MNTIHAAAYLATAAIFAVALWAATRGTGTMPDQTRQALDARTAILESFAK